MTDKKDHYLASDLDSHKAIYHASHNLLFSTS